MTFDERYDANVDRSGGPDACWPWTAGLTQGYGRIRRGGPKISAHRVALERRLGRAIRLGFCSLHHCDNPPCCNPTHLFEGTDADNVRDRDEKGRVQRGSKHYFAKLANDDIREIRRRSAAGETQTALAAEFEVAQTGISKIILRQTWGHIS